MQNVKTRYCDTPSSVEGVEKITEWNGYIGWNSTNRPLHTQQSKQKCNPVVPAIRLVVNTLRAKYVLRRVHVLVACRR
jgi:hypothetical protein